MKGEERKEIIEKLEIMANHGQFEGYPENDMDFNELKDNELSWYRDNWFEGQFDN